MNRNKFIKRVVWILLFVCFGLPPYLSAHQKTLNVYGPGGPLGPMKEGAEIFSKAQGIEVKVVAGPESQWIAQAKQDADLIFGGAEYMLTQFIQNHPELLDEKTRETLYIRAAGILVRKGNPKQIKSLRDLAKEGVRLLDVNGAGQLGLWEDLAGVQGLIPKIQKNIAVSVTTSVEAIERWKSMPGLDVWITFESWHYRLRDITDLVRLPEKERIYRGTPIAFTKISKNKEKAKQFIDFLKIEQAHTVFQKWGWK